MGRMSRTRRELQEAGHHVGFIKGKVEIMRCIDPDCQAARSACTVKGCLAVHGPEDAR